MRATSEPVEGNKVRLSVEVDEPEVDQVLDEAVRTLSRQVRVPGFRPGKVPRRVLEARMGGAVALRAEALRDAIPDFYAQALTEAEVDPIAPPSIDITAGQEAGALAFDAVVEVRPHVAIPGYGGLRVTVPSPEVTDADIDAQVDRLRETDAELEPVDRPARDGDHVTIDLHGVGSAGEEKVATDDLLYEVGSGRVGPELDQQLRGAKVGDVLAFRAPVPGEESETSFKVLVKEVKEKKLPPVTDEWAAESSEFATVAELREDLRDRMARVKVVQAQLSLRQAVMAALVDLVDDEIPEVLVEEEVRQRLHDLGHRLEEQRMTMEDLLAATGQTADKLVAEVRTDALRTVKGDLALRALAEAESLDVTDGELDAELQAMAQQMKTGTAELRAQLTRAGRMAAVRSEQRKAKALAWLLDHAEVVDEEGKPVSREDLKIDQGAPTAGAPGSGDAAEDGDVGVGAGTGSEAHATEVAAGADDPVPAETGRVEAKRTSGEAGE